MENMPGTTSKFLGIYMARTAVEDGARMDRGHQKWWRFSRRRRSNIRLPLLLIELDFSNALIL